MLISAIREIIREKQPDVIVSPQYSRSKKSTSPCSPWSRIWRR
jgi:hypothetical protein